MRRIPPFTAALLIASLALAGCDTHKDKPTLTMTGIVNVGPAADYPSGAVSQKYLAQYGIILTNDSGPVLAIHPMSTYDGEPVTWDDDHNEFVSTTDVSKFNILGQVIKGPARQPLPAVEATKNADGTLSVDLDKLYQKVTAATPAKKPDKPMPNFW